MSSGLMFYDIIMNMIRNKALEWHVETVDSYFTNIENNIIYMYRGSLRNFYWRKFTHEILDIEYLHLNVERIKMRIYLTNILKLDNSSDDMIKNIDHWLDSFKKFHKKYIILLTWSYHSSFPEDCRYTAVRSLPGFINQENETRYYFNATIKLLYCNVIFRQLILNIDWYTMIISLDKNNKTFPHHYQNIMIVEELYKCFGEIHWGKIHNYWWVIYYYKNKDGLS